ncbi:Tic20 family protein [Synechococcus sp. UW140]|uniref:Tic20 family protein n=1 Tax=Synechococcus sp. UW140 TaxID=368503 RepID=UPI000E0ED91C|nr:Tic20 family protein [Synechococcus sp. UW140]
MSIPVWQRLLGLLVYLLPLSDALPFGESLVTQYPILGLFLLPAVPLVILEQSIRFGPLALGGLLLFFVLFLGVVRNPNVPYFLRFNTLQALLIDIVVILITYVYRPLSLQLGSLGDGLVIRTLGSTVLLGVLGIVIFALIECLRGREPDLPGISQAVRMQLY